MSHPILSQSFSQSIPTFSNNLHHFTDSDQHSFYSQNYHQSTPSHFNLDNIKPKCDTFSASPSLYKHNNFQPLSPSLLDNHLSQTEINSPTTTAFTRSDSKDDDQEDLIQKMKSPMYHDIDAKGYMSFRSKGLKGSENEHGASSINERSKKILKRRSYKDPEETSTSSSGKKSPKKGKRSSWSSHEDNKLMDLMKTYGKKWSKIAALMEGRTGKQVRDRYVNVLMPDINRTGWDESEDQVILSTYQKIGPKWSKIAESLEGRTEGQVKNRFYSFLKKKFGKEEETAEVQSSFAEEESSKDSKPMKEEAQEYNVLQQCLQRVEEISQTSFVEPRYPTQIREFNQYQSTNSYFPYAYNNYQYNINNHKDYFSGSFYPSVKVSDPTDVISFDQYAEEDASTSHLKYYLTDFEN